MKYTAFIMTLICTVGFCETTNVVGVAKGWFFLTDEATVDQDGMMCVPVYESIRKKEGRIQVGNKEFVKFIHTSPRVFILSDPDRTNHVMFVLATYPFPDIRGGIGSIQVDVFKKGNIVTLKLNSIGRDEYNKRVNGLFVVDADMKLGASPPYPAQDEGRLFGDKAGFFELEDIYDFSTDYKDMRKNDWLSVYRGYKQKIIFKEAEGEQYLKIGK